jgi:hypothetical protein
MPGFIGPSHGSKPIAFILRPAQVTAIPRYQVLVDSAIIAGKTTIIPDDRGPFTDFGTLLTATSVVFTEIEFIHPTGSWGPFDTDSGSI